MKLALALGLASALVSQPLAAADPPRPVDPSGVVPETPTIPSLLTLSEAVRLARTRGLDILLAVSQVHSAEADLQSAAAIPNPTASFAAGPTFNYTAHPAQACVGCQQYALQWQLGDGNAIFDVLSGKRSLRRDAARASLEAAHLGRADAERSLLGLVKQAYVQLVLARASLDFSRETQASLEATAALSRRRYPGVIDEGALARIEVQALEAEQAVVSSQQQLRQAQVALALLLGVRAAIPDFEVERTLRTLRIPAELEGATEESLLRIAVATRPDLRASEQQIVRAEASVALAKRNQVPDLGLFASYSQLGMGQNAGQPMNMVFGIQGTLPVFYQGQGEIRRAQADHLATSVMAEKARAQVVNDVAAALASYRASRALVERMEQLILPRARRARDVVEMQFRTGSATLMDFLDASRTWIAANQEWLQDMEAYWVAVFQLEQAIGRELR